MIKHYNKLLLVVLSVFFLMGTQLNAQEYVSTPVAVSKEKVRIDGKVYLSHIVLEKQTLYSIAKAYGVQVDDIYHANPQLRDTGLQKNSIIMIPYVKEEDKISQEPPVELVVKEEKVQEVEKKRKKGVTHTVKWFEDIESIARAYEVSVEDIMRANNLESRKLSKRQKLYIPSFEEIAIAQKAQKDILEKQEKVSPDSLEQEAFIQDIIQPKNKVSAAVILPFKSNSDAVSRNNMDMYCGVLLAAHELGEKGIQLDLKVYDSAAESIRKDMIKSCDFIIGPMFSEQIQAIYSKYPEVSPIISPLHPMTESLSFKYVSFIHAPTPQRIQYEDMIAWAMEDMQINDEVIVISEKTGGLDIYRNITSTLDRNNIKYGKYSYSILESREIEESLKTLFTLEGTNRVFIASESEAFVNDALKNINVLSEKNYKIALYGPAKIRSFETVNIANFHSTNLHLVSSFDINYDSEEVKDFILKYRALFNAEPSQFAFQGYDLAMYFGSICAKYGDAWLNYLSSENKTLLQTKFAFQKIENGGFINLGTKRAIFEKNFKTTEVTP